MPVLWGIAMSNRRTLAEEFINEPREAHAFVNGFYVGYTAIPNKNTWNEPHYWKAGFLIGRIAQMLTPIGLIAVGGML